MKNLYLRSTFRDIRQSLGRFVAIILIIFMGVLLFVGIKSVGPNLEETVQEHVTKYDVSDLQLVGTAGLTEKDRQLAETVKGTQGELGYSFPYTEKKQDLNLQVYSYNKEKKQNKLVLKSGRYPRSDGEILVDDQLRGEYPLGSQLPIKEDQLKKQEFTVVGFVESAFYIDQSERGNTTVGDGSLDGFVYLPETAFDSEAYSILYLRFTDLKGKAIASEAYKQALTKKENQLETLFAQRKKERKQELATTIQSELTKNQKELAANQQKLADGQEQLSAAKEQLQQQRSQLQSQKDQLIAAFGQAAADTQLAEAEAQLADGEAALQEQQAALTKNQQKLADGQKQLAAAKEELAELKTPNYLMTERDSNPGFGEFTSLSDRIDAIGNVFPVFFFLIGILITFTTITRMIEEDRKEIGTLKALGYRNREIAQKYLLYAVLTGVIGTILGIIVGTKAIPTIVFSMLKKNFLFQTYPTHYWLVPILLAMAAAAVSTLVSTSYILIKDLHEKPMALLMPKAPKPGKRIILEYITPLWRRLSFNQKVTYRNLFRYKARMILTILGIAGCTGLMVAGFGLRDSIGEVANVQFNQLNHFQGIVTLKDGMTAANATAAKQVLTDSKQVKESYAVHTEQVKFKEEGIMDQAATIYAINGKDRLAEYFTLNKTTNDSRLTLADNGAIITKGIAEAYAAKVGDQLTMQDDEGQKLQIKVSGIVENYLGNNVFLKQTYLSRLKQEELASNSFLVKLGNLSDKQEAALANRLQDTDQVITTTFMSDQIGKQGMVNGNLQPVVMIFIVLSGTLAFVVLFNLTNINVSERERELATIKVLGFFDDEVTMYIVRENIIFTLIGILLGFGIGKILTWFIITMAASDAISFPLIIPTSGYVIAAALTILFSGIVMYITHLKLKGIDMISALKSNE